MIPTDFFGKPREIIHNCAEILKPPRRMTVDDAAAQYLRLNVPGGYTGPWDGETSPYMVEPMRCLTERKYKAVIFVAPARTGKTLSLLDAWHTYIIICDPGDMIIVQTSQETARDYSRMRIDRNHRNSPELKRRLSGRRNDDNTHDKYYSAGNMCKIGWPSINQLSGRDFRYVALTDYDRMPENIDGEGSPFELASKRTQTFMSSGMTMVESSPGAVLIDRKWEPRTPHEAPPVGGIFALYNRGDRRRFYWKCPECESYFDSGRYMEIFHIPDEGEDVFDRARKVKVVCQECGSLISHTHKKKLNAEGVWLREGQTVVDGKVTGKGLDSDIASFWCGGATAAFQSWESIVVKYLQAQEEFEQTGSELALQTVVNTDLGAAYLKQNIGKERNADVLQERAEAFAEKCVPSGVRFLTAFADTQKSRWEIQVQGWGEGLQCWIIDRFSLRLSHRYDENKRSYPVDPAAYLEDWDLLIKYLVKKRYPLDDESGRVMAIKMTGCDMHGIEGVSANAYNFYRKLKRLSLHKTFRLIRGGNRPSAPRVKESYPDNIKRSDRFADARGEVPVLTVNVTELKDNLVADLERETPGAGYVNFPDWLETSFFRELTAEERTEKGWAKNSRQPNEAFDLMVYNKAGTIYLGADRINWEKPPVWAAAWDKNPFVVAEGDKDPISNMGTLKQLFRKRMPK